MQDGQRAKREALHPIFMGQPVRFHAAAHLYPARASSLDCRIAARASSPGER